LNIQEDGIRGVGRPGGDAMALTAPNMGELSFPWRSVETIHSAWENDVEVYPMSLLPKVQLRFILIDSGSTSFFHWTIARGYGILPTRKPPFFEKYNTTED